MKEKEKMCFSKNSSILLGIFNLKKAFHTLIKVELTFILINTGYKIFLIDFLFKKNIKRFFILLKTFLISSKNFLCF